MALQEKQLAQARPSGTSAVSIYSPASGVTAIIKNITICNTTGANVTFCVFHHDTGTTYDESTALYFEVTIDKRSTLSLTPFMAMNNDAGNLAVKTSVGNALTFTVYGAEVI